MAAICSVCQQPAQQKCAGCHLVYYCSRDHQKSDWKTHKQLCKPYEICENDTLGRHLIATRDMKAGNVIVKETPLVWGPSQVTLPVCLGCGKGVTEKKNYPCQKCGWPMCSEICQNSPSHLPECSYTVNRGDKVSVSVFHIPNPSYQCITTLRCLYNKQFLPKIWKKLDVLESHCEQRKKTENYATEKTTVAAFIRRFFKIETFTEEEILRVCGIIMVNGHEVPISEPPHVAIYEITSMFEHSCKANCSKTFTSNGGVLITAGGDIKKGDHLSICYTDPLWGTPNRRHHLYESKYFWCKCQRCSDVTEFGTYFSAIRCNKKDCKGIAVPKTFLVDSMEASNQNWFCNKCSEEFGADEVNGMIEDLGKRLHEMQKGNSNACKLFLKQCDQSLAPNHYYITDVKFALAQLLGQEFRDGLTNLSDDDLQFKIALCKQVLNVAKQISPGENRITGILLFELHAALAEFGGRKGQSGQLDSNHLYSVLLESEGYLVEAIDKLRYEPEVMPEGKICQQGRKNLRDIQMVLATTMKALAGAQAPM